ncbi:MAG: YkgJ family cysteine cluster protein [Gemmataceae bacterium]|nr:YkgJ family cysteine cluster protein [Gemmataceae bacterium]
MGKEEPWYEEGLRFGCTRCGHCCTGEPGHVWVSEDEMQAIADFTGEPVSEFRFLRVRQSDGKNTLREKANGDCIYYEKGQGCVIYPVRPVQCQTWPFWKSRASTAERWEETMRMCPGAGKGDLISPEEITLRMKRFPI